MKNWKYLMMTSVVGSALFLGACGNSDDSASKSNNGSTEQKADASQKLEGKISGDGSSTVAPIWKQS